MPAETAGSSAPAALRRRDWPDGHGLARFCGLDRIRAVPNLQGISSYHPWQPAGARKEAGLAIWQRAPRRPTFSRTTWCGLSTPKLQSPGAQQPSLRAESLLSLTCSSFGKGWRRSLWNSPSRRGAARGCNRDGPPPVRRLPACCQPPARLPPPARRQRAGQADALRMCRRLAPPRCRLTTTQRRESSPMA
jgi:hypothetical protein